MRSRVIATAAFTAGLLALVGSSSCGLIRSLGTADAPPPRPFNHLAHIDRGLDCASCHETAATAVRAGMPSKEVCMACHEDIDKDPAVPAEKKVAWFLGPDGQPRWSAFTKQAEEVIFSHAAHAKTACADCHVGIDKDTGLVPPLLQRMASCTSCHERQAPAKNDCASCHQEIGRDRAPASHARMWSKRHGLCAREGAAVSTANDCALCHATDACTTCHMTQAPADHTGTWRFKPHGIAATVDRVRCFVCHASDACNRCHEETAPRSHTAGWNAPRNNHCNGCHLPLARSGSCFVCHKSAPAHDASPPMPPWHNAAMNCRSCHGLSLKHPDNGDTCTACHR